MNTQALVYSKNGNCTAMRVNTLGKKGKSWAIEFTY